MSAPFESDPIPEIKVLRGPLLLTSKLSGSAETDNYL